MKKIWEIDGTSKENLTPEFLFNHRREIMKHGLVLGTALLIPEAVRAALLFPAKANSQFKADGLTLTKENLATSYNNFYEFSLEKGEVKPKTEAWNLDAAKWMVDVGGLTDQKRSYGVEELANLAGGMEERIYRFRCVEAWSMVVPWTGFPLSKLIDKLKPKKSAKFVHFQTFSDTKIGSNIKRLPQYPWPYTEGLTMEEALHPLTFVATGMYGKPLPKQNGAPIRLIVPWKYGFKSIKSIVQLNFVDQQPKTLWNQLAPAEYGFYANVNPNVAHPRWSQATERILDSSLFPKRQPTLMFNGYEKEVAGLYKGLDLVKNY